MTSLLTSCHIQHLCLHYKCLFYSNLPQTTINKAINDLRKRLHACVSADGEHFEHITWTRLSRLIWHNFVKVGYNCIKICNLAKIGTYNRCVKNRLKILNRLWKKWKMSCPQGGIFLDSHCILWQTVLVETLNHAQSINQSQHIAIMQQHNRQVPCISKDILKSYS